MNDVYGGELWVRLGLYLALSIVVFLGLLWVYKMGADKAEKWGNSRRLGGHSLVAIVAGGIGIFIALIGNPDAGMAAFIVILAFWLFTSFCATMAMMK